MIYVDNPCIGCDHGWGTISTDGCTSCRDDCPELKRFMDSAQTGVDRGTHCETCIHEPVCSYRAQFSEILGATQRSDHRWFTVEYDDEHHFRVCFNFSDIGDTVWKI